LTAIPEIELMPASDTTTSGPRLLAVSCAGGMARQFRVQSRDGEVQGWSLVGSFRDQQIAEKVAAGLRRSGREVRVVACQSLPTAA
jgi:hypothetical protein